MRGSGSQENRLRNSFDTYTGTINEAVKLATELLNDQSEYAAAVAFIRESGGRVIQQMRDQHFERSASDTFQLVVGTLDFAGSRPTVQEAELRRLLVALSRDQRVDGMPADVLRLRNAMETVVTKRDSIRGKLEQLAAAPVVVNGKNLGSAAQDLYKATVARVDQARLMLAVYAVVLLLAVGFVAFRLHGSYREINAANDELARAQRIARAARHRAHRTSSRARSRTSKSRRCSSFRPRRCRRSVSSSPASVTRSTRRSSISRTTPS